MSKLTQIPKHLYKFSDLECIDKTSTKRYNISKGYWSESYKMEWREKPTFNHTEKAQLWNGLGKDGKQRDTS